MDSRRLSRPARPQSVREIVSQAENFTFNTNIPFKHWARAADTLHQEASFALADGDHGRAYMMLYRHSLLILNLLPTHPQFKSPESQRAFKPLSRRIDSILGDLEHLKPAINEEYADWERIASAQPAPPLPGKSLSPAADHLGLTLDDIGRGRLAQVLDASDHQDLAVDLAQKELARRENARSSLRAAPPTSDALHLYGSLPQDQRDATSEPAKGGIASVLPISQYSYPSIAKSKPVDYQPSGWRVMSSATSPTSRSANSQLSPPPPPPKGGATRPTQSLAYAPPAIPHKVPLLDGNSPRPSSPPPPRGQLNTPPRPKKERLSFKPGAYLENGDPIRPVFLPSKLRQTFLEIASKHTEAGLEMCGILCGTPVNNALFVRCLLIPDQRCTPDTCETENESAVFDYCSGEDLLVLGWIHTHPTQTCFMSSRDLHTHSGYQVMMPESIAIVCAPRFQPS